jgi:hypothetical protein
MSYRHGMRDRSRLGVAGAAAFVLVVAFLIATAIAGAGGSTQRETMVRARVWCEALVDRDAFRYQDAFRRGYFRGRLDRAANVYREPTEAEILAQMPRTSACRPSAKPRGPDERGEVYLPVSTDAGPATLRMRREAGFWVVWQIL